MGKQLLSYIVMSFLQLRKDNNLTQQQMADQVGIHITQVKRYEAGQAKPSTELLKKTANAFNDSTISAYYSISDRWHDFKAYC